MTTIHAYTNDQNIVDGNHNDPRRARSAAVSMIPTSTGAASAIGLVLPELKGKLDGGAIRVPTPNVSMTDFNFIAKRKVSIEEINDLILKKSQEGKMKQVLQYVDEPLVSIDFNHNQYSSCFDSTQTKVIDNLVKICSWYDNEWGFSVRMLDVARIL
jgi:glyceraldehyde 3-phosphate dehydrogenase